MARGYQAGGLCVYGLLCMHSWQQFVLVTHAGGSSTAWRAEARAMIGRQPAAMHPELRCLYVMLPVRSSSTA